MSVSAPLPSPPASTNAWLDALDRANKLNLIPILLAIYIGWTSREATTQARADLMAAEARTRAALAECKSEAATQAGRTRDVVRDAARATQPAPVPTPAGEP